MRATSPWMTRRMIKMEFNGLLQKFLSLRNSDNVVSEAYKVLNISHRNGHKLGYTEDGFPVIFIECSDIRKTSDIRLQLVDVLFNRECSLYSAKEKIENKTYCLVILKSLQDDLISYFLEVFTLVLDRLPPFPSTMELGKEIATLVRLFTNLPTYSLETLQGLWAEMLVIEQSSNPDYLISSWHVSTMDKYDFNDGNDKIEVKSTLKNNRLHQFAIEQLNPNENSRLVIASVQMVKTGVGYSIFDLEKNITAKLNQNDSIIKLKEMILKTLGVKSENASTVYYDYSFAVESLKFYDYRDIPSISLKDVPANVSGVHFVSDLTSVSDVNRESMIGILHESL